MQRKTQDQPLWLAVAQLEQDSLKAWRSATAPDLDLESALTQRVTAVETHISRRLGGNVSVTVSVLAKKVQDCNVDYFYLQRAGNKMYRTAEPPSSAT